VKPVTAFSHLTLAALMAATAFTAIPARAAPKPEARPTPNLAVSAEFAPARFVVSDSTRRERLKRFLRKDSTDAFSMKGNTFRLSRRALMRLAAEEGDTGADEATRRHKARLRLQREAGGPVEEAAPAYPAGYLPADAAYIHNATQKEEDKDHCRQKTLWAYLDTSVLCGHAAGAGVNMAPVWERFDGADTLVIAVLDAGFDFLHHDLQGRYAVNAAEANGAPGVDDDNNGFIDDVRGWDFVDGDNDAQDYNGHGTMTGGVIAASFENGTGIPGMVPRVRILPVRVLSTAGFGNTEDIAAGIRYAVARGAHAINFSIGIGSGTTNTTLRNAFIAARDAGVIVSAATGNSGLDLDANPRQPFSYGFANVYGVAAHDQSKHITGFSNYGATKADLTAPGDHIVTTGIPPALTRHTEKFENFNDPRWTFTGGTWQASPDTMEGAKSLRWVSGNTTTAALDSIDLRGKRGGLLTFRLSLTPANSSDGLDIYVLPAGSTEPISVGGTGSTLNNELISVNLGDVDDKLFKLMFRVCVYNTSGTACSGTRSASGRVLRIDDLRIEYADLDSAKHNVVTVTGGTSLAAPYFAGYAGLMRLASDRMGVPLTRSLMLAGVTTDPIYAGKVATGGRLNAAKGLDFYLRTLPRIAVSDTLDTSWAPGAAVAYALTVRDSAGPRTGFTFSPIGLPAGGTLSPTGAFAWNSGTSALGGYALRAKATSGPLVLRTLVSFSLVSATPVRAAAPHQESRVRIGNRAFLLPAGAFASGAQTLRVEFYGSDGRLMRRTEGLLTPPSGVRAATYDLAGLRVENAAGVRAWLNGVALRGERP